MAPLPMNSPCLMSVIDAFSTSTTIVLSARLIFSSSPLSDFAVKVLPSSFSMVPRKCTVCGAWANAAVATSVAATAMSVCFAIMAIRSHRRVDAVGADRDVRRIERTFRLLGRAGEHDGARLEIACGGGCERHDRDI